MAETVIQNARSSVEEWVQATLQEEVLAQPDMHELPGSQRQVYQAMRTGVLQRRRAAERARRAAERYDPIVLPSSVSAGNRWGSTDYLQGRQPWYVGLAVHEHWPWQHWDPIALTLAVDALSLVPAFVVGAVIVALLQAPVLGVVASVASLTASWYVAENTLRRYLRRAHRENCVAYARPIPLAALRAYSEARRSGLFEDILIYSPDRSAFELDPRSVSRADPLMVGRIEKFYFLIACWDLDQDLKFAADVTGGVRL